MGQFVVAMSQQLISAMPLLSSLYILSSFMGGDGEEKCVSCVKQWPGVKEVYV